VELHPSIESFLDVNPCNVHLQLARIPSLRLAPRRTLPPALSPTLPLFPRARTPRLNLNLSLTLLLSLRRTLLRLPRTLLLNRPLTLLRLRLTLLLSLPLILSPTPCPSPALSHPPRNPPLSPTPVAPHLSLPSSPLFILIKKMFVGCAGDSYGIFTCVGGVMMGQDVVVNSRMLHFPPTAFSPSHSFFFHPAQVWDGVYILEGPTTISAQVTIAGAQVTFQDNVTLNDEIYFDKNSSVLCTVACPSFSLALFY